MVDDHADFAVEQNGGVGTCQPLAFRTVVGVNALNQVWAGINDRLEKEIGDKARDVRQGGYEKWLMIVGPDGKIEAIHKLNPGATGIKQTVKP